MYTGNANHLHFTSNLTNKQYHVYCGFTKFGFNANSIPVFGYIEVLPGLRGALTANFVRIIFELITTDYSKTETESLKRRLARGKGDLFDC